MTQSNWSFPVVQCQQKIEQLPPSTSWAQLQQRWQQEATGIDKGAPCHASHHWLYLPANYQTTESPNVNRKESKCHLGPHRLNLNNVVDQKPATSSKEHYAILATIHSQPQHEPKMEQVHARKTKAQPHQALVARSRQHWRGNSKSSWQRPVPPCSSTLNNWAA